MATTTKPLAWIVGSGGLFGRALSRRARRIDVDVFDASAVAWADPGIRARQLHAGAEEFSTLAAGRSAFVLWAAGNTSVASTKAEAQSENGALRDLVYSIKGMTGPSSLTFFLASSAGGVYAGSTSPPFDSESDVAPISPYGESKLWQESYVQHELSAHGRIEIGRLSNLYGTALSNRRGLVTRLCNAALTREALSLFVPQDTLRDYCFADDAAELVWNDLLCTSSDGRIRVIGSGSAATVGHVIHSVQRVTHRRVPIALGVDPESQLQPIDLRLAPDWTRTDPEFQPTTLEAGIKRVVDHMVTEMKL